MASSPKGSPPSSRVSSPPPPAGDKSTAPPPVPASSPPNPPSAPPSPPAESNSPSPPSYSSTSSSSPPSTPALLPPTSPSTSPSPPSTLSSSPSSPSSWTSPTISTSKSPSSSSTRSSTSPSRKPSSNNNGNNQNNTTVTNPTPSPPPLSPPSLSSPSSSPPPLPANSPLENSLPNPSSTPILSSPPPTSNSSTNQIENTPKSSSMPFSSTLPIIIGVPVSVGLLLGLILMCLNAMRTKRKEDLEKHVQKGDAEKGIGNKANEHADNILVSPSGIVGKGGSPREEAPPYFSPKYQSPLGINKCSFTYEELAIATQGFSQKNLLGQGGFGFVHKGVLPNGREVAVKSLKSGSGQGQREFQAEVEIISRIHHRHLVSLVGFSIAGDKKMLVYEFLPNKTLQFHLHEKGLPTMDWPTRLKIALGAAKGLSYLHEDCHPRIIHRDIKSANILLDFCFEAMVADFGLAKLTQDSNTHVSTRVMGTFGYLAPEYVSSGKLTNKSDVFSFGVVLLELITGRRPYNPTSNMDESLVDWARPLCARAIEDGKFGQLVDPRLGNNFVDHEMASMVSCASACVRHSARQRPKMRQIVCALEDGVPLDDLSETSKLDQSSTSNSKSDDTSNESSSYTLESKEYGSNNNDDTNHCHLNPSSFSSDSSETTSKARDDLK
ncbi:proline-rich receptor-like protein kinase PERK5 [Gossypium raimondii]|uniref:non-specific serine/threonine protein kinase n=2 Tax=Gossypium raimondii TaxID=29730 RepID=A0A0D2QY97_GOSRA|nr:proline-rich receptor-like protein kinase PERK5 [Gossypium raimondii]KJB12205.1 hypothetical protein B456_002G005900 [Gossypium raimondii]